MSFFLLFWVRVRLGGDEVGYVLIFCYSIQLMPRRDVMIIEGNYNVWEEKLVALDNVT